MKIGFISDAHGNAVGLKLALEQLQEVDRVDRIYFLGDHVGYMPDVNEVIEKIRSSCYHSLSGNHDAMLLGRISYDSSREEIYKLQKAKEELHQRHQDYLSKLIPFHESIISGKKILMVHGSPFDPLNGYAYEDKISDTFYELGYDYIFMAHTHRPFILKKNKVTLVNTGSCGLPRDKGDMISVVVFEPEEDKVEIKRIKMNIDEVCRNYKNNIHESVVECLNR